MSANVTKKRNRPRKAAPGRIDLARMRRVSEADIMRTSPPELANLPADFWGEAQLVAPVIKQAISLRVDPDVLAWFRAQGPRYQTRMNAVLRTYMTQMRTRRVKKRAG
ncbi:MAG: hypothetical protein MNPFHGCM_02685 [Gemmatimonadaceae bacterium]|nr:hypothetical protein [Gemmatimonadaceae bacterium]